MIEPIHQHLLIRAKVSNMSTQPITGIDMLVDLVENIGMVPVTAPQCVYVAEPGNEGLTGSINLATSHIAFHVWDVIGLLMLDVYSCKSFAVSKVLETLDQYMDIETMSYKVINRLEDI